MDKQEKIGSHWLSLASDMALKSTCRIRVGAVIVNNRKIVSKGFNRPKTHPLVCKYSYWEGSNLHAEMDAVLKARKGPLKGSTIYVSRLYRDGMRAPSKPCQGCLEMLKDKGIKEIIFL